MNQSKRTVLITGASAGIGKAFAEQFARKGWDLVITARREERLQALADELHGRHGAQVTVIGEDLGDAAAPQRIYEAVVAKGITIDGLVNNAGYGVPGHFVNTSWDTQQIFLQVLVTSVAHLCHLFLPGMIERDYGRIINVSSLNGLIPCSPGQTLYASAKSFVVALSHTLQAEVIDNNIYVSALCPGFTYSEFHDVTGTRDMVSKMPANQWMTAEDVVKLGYDAVMRGDPLCVTGRSSKINAILAKFLPRKMLIQTMVSRSKSFRKT